MGDTNRQHIMFVTERISSRSRDEKINSGCVFNCEMVDDGDK